MKMTRKDFLRTSAAAGTALFTGASLFTATAGASTAITARPRKGRMTLIKGATILSMDPKLGDIMGGDVLINGSKILKVGRNIEAPDADLIDAKDMILMPGMCDGHRHLWESMAVTRPDLTLVTWHMMWAVGMTPKDAYDFTYLGGKMAMNSGVTRVSTTATLRTLRKRWRQRHEGRLILGLVVLTAPNLVALPPLSRAIP